MTDKSSNPLKAIRAKCLDCCCNDKGEVKLCPCAECALHPFRFGKNPFRVKREYTAEQKEMMAQRLRGSRVGEDR